MCSIRTSASLENMIELVFKTLFISNKDTFHMGYYRVSPDQMPMFVVANEGHNKIITSEGSNLLGTGCYNITTFFFLKALKLSLTNSKKPPLKITSG